MLNEVDIIREPGIEESRKQQLRLFRFSMAVLTYWMEFLALFLITRLDLGSLNLIDWALIIGVSLSGNIIFLIIFLTEINLRFSDPSLTKEQIIFASFWGMFPLLALPTARPVMLMFFLPAFGFGMLRLDLKQYLTATAWNLIFYGLVITFEFFTMRPGFKLGYEIFLFLLFAMLLFWLSFFGGFISKLRYGLKKEVAIRKQAEKEKDQLIGDLKRSIKEVKTLSGLLPICASCKKIRDDKGYWNQIEKYIRDNSQASFSHGICPDCAQHLYPDLITPEEKG